MKKTLLALLLSLTLFVLTSAGAETFPAVSIGGISLQPGDYLHVGAGAVSSAAPASGSGYAHLSADGKTLTLNHFSIQIHSPAAGSLIAIDAAPVTIRLVGQNTLQASGGEKDGIAAKKNLTIQGGAGDTLSIDVPGDGIDAAADLHITGGGIGTKNVKKALYSSGGNITIDGGSLDIDSQENSVFAQNGDITIRGGSVKVSTLGQYTLYARSRLIIDGSQSAGNAPRITASAGMLGDKEVVVKNAAISIAKTDVQINRGLNSLGTMLIENSQISVSMTAKTGGNDMLYLGGVSSLETMRVINSDISVVVTAMGGPYLRSEGVISGSELILEGSDVRYTIHSDCSVIDDTAFVGTDGISLLDGSKFSFTSNNPGIFQGSFMVTTKDITIENSALDINVTTQAETSVYSSGVYAGGSICMTNGSVEIQTNLPQTPALNARGSITIADSHVTASSAGEGGVSILAAGDVIIEDSGRDATMLDLTYRKHAIISRQGEIVCGLPMADSVEIRDVEENGVCGQVLDYTSALDAQDTVSMRNIRIPMVMFVPATGDSAMVALWALMAVVSAAATVRLSRRARG